MLEPDVNRNVDAENDQDGQEELHERGHHVVRRSEWPRLVCGADEDVLDGGRFEADEGPQRGVDEEGD